MKQKYNIKSRVCLQMRACVSVRVWASARVGASVCRAIDFHDRVEGWTGPPLSQMWLHLDYIGPLSKRGEPIRVRTGPRGSEGLLLFVSIA